MFYPALWADLGLNQALSQNLIGSGIEVWNFQSEMDDVIKPENYFKNDYHPKPELHRLVAEKVVEKLDESKE